MDKGSGILSQISVIARHLISYTCGKSEVKVIVSSQEGPHETGGITIKTFYSLCQKLSYTDHVEKTALMHCF